MCRVRHIYPNPRAFSAERLSPSNRSCKENWDLLSSSGVFVKFEARLSGCHPYEGRKKEARTSEISRIRASDQAFQPGLLKKLLEVPILVTTA